jgi:glutamate carboxypeptidase
MNQARLTRLQTQLTEREPAMLDLLRRLVAINSHTRNRAGVLANAELICAAFEPLGFRLERLPDDDPARGDHLCLQRRGDRPGAIALVSHLDTVYTSAQEAANQFRWREDGDRIYGPGVADVKGGSALIWLVLSTLARAEPELFQALEWIVLFNAAEEEGNRLFPPWARGKLANRPRALLVYEPGNRSTTGSGECVTTSRRGSSRFVVETFGREAHAGAAHQRGASAIRQLARTIERIESMTDYSAGSTCNVGIIEGGMASNTVPGWARAEVDARAESREAQAQQIAALLALSGDGEIVSAEDPFRCRVSVHQTSCYPPWPESAASRELAELAAQLAAESGIDLHGERRGGASDANHLWDLAPTLCSLGPLGAHIHSSIHDPARGLFQESIERHSIVPRALLSCRLIERIADRSE